MNIHIGHIDLKLEIEIKDGESIIFLLIKKMKNQLKNQVF
mgnify:FL=1